MIYTITAIEWESFPPECREGLPAPDALPITISEPEDQGYRSDAAYAGILAHSPYCDYCDSCDSD